MFSRYNEFVLSSSFSHYNKLISSFSCYNELKGSFFLLPVFGIDVYKGRGRLFKKQPTTVKVHFGGFYHGYCANLNSLLNFVKNCYIFL